MKFRTVTALLVATGVALTGTATADAAPKKSKRVSSQKVLKRALRRVRRTTRRSCTCGCAPPRRGIGTFTDDVWMHVGGAGFVDKVRELRVDGTLRRARERPDQPNGLGDPTGAVGRKRESASAPISTHRGRQLQRLDASAA